MAEIEEESNSKKAGAGLPTIESSLISSVTKSQDIKEASEKDDNSSITKSQDIKGMSDIKPLIDAQIRKQSVLLSKQVQTELLDSLKLYINEKVKEVTKNTKKDRR